MTKRRLNDYARIVLQSNGAFTIETRSSKSQHFGHEKTLSLNTEEAHELRDLLNEELDDD